MTPYDLQANLYQVPRKGRLLVLFTNLSVFLQIHRYADPLPTLLAVHLEVPLVGLLVVYHQTLFPTAHHVCSVVQLMAEYPLAVVEAQVRLVD